jgi:hypothetical protein
MMESVWIYGMTILSADRTGSWGELNLSGRMAGTGNLGQGRESNGITFVTNVAVEIQLGVITFEGSTSGD